MKKCNFLNVKIVAFLMSCVFFCLAFSVPTFAYNLPASTFSVHDSYKVGGGDTYSIQHTVSFSTNEVITFIFENDTTNTDNYNNVKRGVIYYYTSKSPFSGSIEFNRKYDQGDWSETETEDIPLRDFREDYNCYFYFSSVYWSSTYSPTFSGKYVRVRITDFQNGPKDVISRYYSGEDLSDVIVESNLDGSGIYDESIGFLDNIQLKHLSTTYDEFVRVSFGSQTTNGFELKSTDSCDVKVEAYFLQHYENVLPSDDKEMISSVYTDDVDSYCVDYSVTELFEWAYENHGQYDFEENKYKRWAEWGAAIFDRWIAESKCYSDIFIRPYVVENGVKRYGGWTKIRVQYNSNGNYDDAKIETGLTDGTGLEDFKNFESTTPDKKVPVYSGSGTTIDEADSNINYSQFESGGVIESSDDMINMLGDFPDLFAKLFSFLPEWCITLIAISFGMAAVLLVAKIVRG